MMICYLSDRVGLIYNEQMKEHVNLWDDKYPEKPERITQPYARCEQYGLIERCVCIPVGIQAV